MLTVKHIHDGIEQVYEAPFGVQFEPGVGLCILGDIEGKLVPNTMMDGVAYVMNNAGQTISTHYLPSSDPVAQRIAEVGQAG